MSSLKQLSGQDPTIAGLLKPLGYLTGQFGKNHPGDRDEFLPWFAGPARLNREPNLTKWWHTTIGSRLYWLLRV